MVSNMSFSPPRDRATRTFADRMCSTHASHDVGFGSSIRSADAGVDDFDFDDVDLAGLDLEVITGKAAELEGKVRTMIKEHPVRSLLVAAAAGFLIGRIVTRI